MSSGSSSSSMRFRDSDAFEHDESRHFLQIGEQCKPALRQEQFAVQPLLQWQEMSFKSSGGAGSCRMGGINPFSVHFHPQSMADFSLPFHNCIWKYVRYECNRAASFEGGRDAKFGMLFVIEREKCRNPSLFSDSIPSAP